MLIVEGLRKGFGAGDVVSDWSVEVGRGEAVFLTGPNGSGKTTILRCLAGIEPCAFSAFSWDGVPCAPVSAEHWRRFYSIADDFAWFPDLTVLDHLSMLGEERLALQALADLDIASLADRTLASLSSGQAQRAALATAGVRDWDVLLLDEPEQRLDGEGVEALAAMLRGLLSRGRTVVASTHLRPLISMVQGRELRCGGVEA